MRSELHYLRGCVILVPDYQGMRPLLRRYFLLLCLALLGGVGGFFLANSGRSASPNSKSVGDSGERKISALTQPNSGSDVAEVSERIAQAADSGDLQALWDSFGDDTRGQIGRLIVIQRWVQIDPEGAFEFFLEDRKRLSDVAVEWALIDPEAAAKRMIGAEKLINFQDVVAALTLRSPEQGVKLITIGYRENLPNNHFGSQSSRWAFAQLFIQDRENALALAETLPEAGKVSALAGIASAMAKSDAPAALEWARALGDEKTREAAMGAVAFEMAKLDPDSAVPLLKEMNEALDWGTPGTKILKNLIREDPRAAIERFDPSSVPSAASDDFARNTEEMLDFLQVSGRAIDTFDAPLEATDTQVHNLLAFLESLTDPCVLDRACMAPWVADPETDDVDGHLLVAVDQEGRPL